MNSELEQMAENIRRTIEAVERAHEQGKALSEDTSSENLRRYQQELRHLLKELKSIDQFIHNEIEVAVEDLSELIQRALTGKRQSLAYRHTPKPSLDESQEDV